jgi:hypothetical protein
METIRLIVPCTALLSMHRPSARSTSADAPPASTRWIQRTAPDSTLAGTNSAGTDRSRSPSYAQRAEASESSHNTSHTLAAFAPVGQWSWSSS